MKKLKIHVTFTEGILGTATADPEIYSRFIGSKSPDAATLPEEVAALGEDAIIERGTTVFPKDEDGTPFLWDYQIKGFFKDACGMLARLSGKDPATGKKRKAVNESGKLTAQGERTALSSSEECPAGTTCEMTILCLDDAHEKAVREWLDYGALRGIGQWRNSSKGRFKWEEVK